MEIIGEKYLINKSLVLYGLADKFDFLVNLFNSERIPQVLLLSGPKGQGKFTLFNHFLKFYYDKENYDFKNYTIKNNSFSNDQLNQKHTNNLIYLSGINSVNNKVETIRSLKNSLLKTSLNNKKRFIILDDVELFNLNSLNALLKIIEEPPKNNFFILINNKTKQLAETIHSRCLEIKFLLTNKNRIGIIEKLIGQFKIENFIDYKINNITPGNFLILNNICEMNNIDLNQDFLFNIDKILNIYKKEKNFYLIKLILFIIEKYFYDLINSNQNKKIEEITQIKLDINKYVDNFLNLHLNQNTLISVINNRLKYE